MSNDLIYRIIALNGAFPDRETWEAWLNTGGCWLLYWDRSWLAYDAMDRRPGSGGTGTWHAIDAQGRRYDNSQEVGRLRAHKESLQGTVQRFRADLRESNADRDRLQAENERLALLLRPVLGAHDTVTLADCVEQAVIVVTDLRDALEDGTAENERLTARVAALEHQLACESLCRQDAEAKGDRLSDESERLTARVAELEAALAQSTGLAEYHELRRDEEEAHYTVLLTTDLKNRQAAEAQARDAQLARDELAAGAAELQRQIGELKERELVLLRRAQKAEKAQEAMIDGYEAEREAHEATRQELVSAVPAISAWLRSGVDSTPARLAERIEAGEWRGFLPVARDELAAELADVRGRRAEIKACLDRWQGRCRQAWEDRRELERELATEREAHEATRTALATAESQRFANPWEYIATAAVTALRDAGVWPAGAEPVHLPDVIRDLVRDGQVEPVAQGEPHSMPAATCTRCTDGWQKLPGERVARCECSRLRYGGAR